LETSSLHIIKINTYDTRNSEHFFGPIQVYKSQQQQKKTYIW